MSADRLTRALARLAGRQLERLLAGDLDPAPLEAARRAVEAEVPLPLLRRGAPPDPELLRVWRAMHGFDRGRE